MCTERIKLWVRTNNKIGFHTKISKCILYTNSLHSRPTNGIDNTNYWRTEKNNNIHYNIDLQVNEVKSIVRSHYKNLFISMTVEHSHVTFGGKCYISLSYPTFYTFSVSAFLTLQTSQYLQNETCIRANSTVCTLTCSRVYTAIFTLTFLIVYSATLLPFA